MLTGQNTNNNSNNDNNNLGNNESNANGNGKRLNEKDKVINETLAVKFSNNEKIFKIPIKFFSQIPSL
jgi:hypothetical protein